MSRFEEFRHEELAELEAEVLQWWEEADIFRKSIADRDGAPSYSFYEGPPTANGRPGIHHVTGRTIKDVFCRYHTMKGYRVERKAGWDTHGLPVEIEVEKTLGLDGREEVIAYGIERFNAECRRSVLAYKQEWDDLTRRMGYWVDRERPYVTFENAYIESVWWLLKQIFDKGLLYKGHKIQWYSPGSGTVLSSHEVSLGYKEVQDPSVYVRFRAQAASFLVWTTTPWTLISNAALAVGPDIDYVRARVEEEEVILAHARLEVLGQEYEILDTMKGSDLVGTVYDPLFETSAEAKRVVAADFVSTADGTGIVHIAPAFGADDYAVGRREGLPVINPIDDRGRFTHAAPLVAGKWFKNADRDIVRDLRSRGLLYRQETCLHNYPHDWRKGTPLMSYPVESWFIRTTALKEQLVALNDSINWQPEAIGRGRFGEWLENNVDWALSRRRFWGTPLPVWQSDRDPSYVEVIGSIAELRAKCGEQLSCGEALDLHRPHVDRLTWPAPEGGVMRRVPETIDVWFDSGAMPFAQWHYPFENKDAFARSFPADFIAEGVDQTRGWFYTLHAISTLVTGSVAFKNCVVNGLVLDEKGEKMSKTKGNTVDPFAVIQRYGADSVRWYLMSNSAPWEDLKFTERGIREAQRKLFRTLANVYNFFATYANIDGFAGKERIIPVAQRAELDRWIMSRLHTTVAEVDAAYKTYHPTRAARPIERFVDELSNWYIRRSRRRFWSAKATDADHPEDDKWAAYQTVAASLVDAARMMAPIAPFFSEWLYRRLRNAVTEALPASVHLADFPVADRNVVNKALEYRMKLAQDVSSITLGLRNQAGINIRQPLEKILIAPHSDGDRDALEQVKEIILSEINVKCMEYVDGSSHIVKKTARPNFRRLGKRYGKLMPAIKAAVHELDACAIAAYEDAGTLTVDIDGIAVCFEAEDLDVVTEGIEGWLVGQDASVTVALDTRLTEPLLDEGSARELINRVQNMRKKGAFDVTDRIDVQYKATEVLDRAITRHRQWIRNETLALSFESANIPTGEIVGTFDIGQAQIRLGIRRVHCDG